MNHLMANQQRILALISRLNE